MTKIEWVRGEDGSEGMSWNALRAVREIQRAGKTITVSANHCEKVNEACRHCYAERMNHRHGGLSFKRQNRGQYSFVLDEEKLVAPLHRRKPTRYFVESMSDAFGEWWPREFIDKLYAVMAMTPHHTYVNLTKRPGRRLHYLEGHWRDRAEDLLEELKPSPLWNGNVTTARHVLGSGEPLPNVIEGTSVSNQDEANEFIPIVLLTKAALRAVSIEPLLGAIDLYNLISGERWFDAIQGHWYRRDHNISRDYGWGDVPRLDLVIVGGESGAGARPMRLDHVLSLRDQCANRGVPFFFKQWGEWGLDPAGRYVRLGKHHSGRLIEGREYNGFPKIRKTETA